VQVFDFIRRIWDFVKIVILSVGQIESEEYYRQSSFQFTSGEYICK